MLDELAKPLLIAFTFTLKHRHHHFYLNLYQLDVERILESFGVYI